MDSSSTVYLYFSFISFVISAKWAMELGVSQFRQILIGVGGFIFGPLMLLILYVMLLQKAKGEGKPSSNFF